MKHTIDYRIYYEDTDAGGVVYYANYLKFAERARTELLRSCDINQTELQQEEDTLFVVRHATLDLKHPATLDDMITITTQITQIQGASVIMQQDITNEDRNLATITVKIASISSEFKPKRLSDTIKQQFHQYIAN